MRAPPLLLATRNRHKVAEIQAILGRPCLGLEDFPAAPPLVEDADSFAGNAARKALQLADWLAGAPGRAGQVPAEGLLVLADDSGLEVDALGGAPGVHSARFAALGTGSGANAGDAENNAKLLHLLGTVPWERRTARFRCALAVVAVKPGAQVGPPRLLEGVCEGRIRLAPSGTGGFGYDPLFVPEGLDQSFAELGAEVKNRISHRARALARLREWLQAPGQQPGSPEARCSRGGPGAG